MDKWDPASKTSADRDSLSADGKENMENIRNELVFTSMKELNEYLKNVDETTMVSITVEVDGQPVQEGEDNGR